jgi:hypothetical protein
MTTVLMKCVIQICRLHTSQVSSGRSVTLFAEFVYSAGASRVVGLYGKDRFPDY